MIRRLYGLVPQPAMLLRLGALSAVQSVLQGVLLGALVPILRALIAPEPDFEAARPWLIATGVGLCAYAVLTIIATPIGFRASIEMAEQLRHRLIDHVATLPLGWFTTPHKARLSRATTTDTGNIAQLAVSVGVQALQAVLTPLAIIAVTFAVDWRIALLLVILMPLALLTLRRAGRISSRAEIELDAASTQIAGRAIELNQAQPVLRASGHGQTGTARMRQALRDHHAVYRDGLRQSIVPDLTFTAVVAGGFVAVLTLVAALLSSGQLGAAEAIAALVLSVRFLEPLGSLVELMGAVHAMGNAIDRVQSILGTRPLPAPKRGAAITRSAVEFDHVTFTYSGSTPAALNDVSAVFPAGSMTALVGASGSGKSSLIRVLARFFDPDQGSVRIGGTDLRDIEPQHIMDAIAVVFQDVYLFDDTIEENLRIARPDATAEELAEAARAANLTAVIDTLPDGWATRVGEGGKRLSGGQRQRVSIARALLKNAPILLIDEATSALDPENEHAVGQAITNLALSGDRTIIVIAHRPATIAAADHVLTLDHGQIIERGTPDELRTTGGRFARLFDEYEHARGWQIARNT